MGGIGVLLRCERLPEERSRLVALHRALWKRIDARLADALISGATRPIHVNYISDQTYDWYEDGRPDGFFGGLAFTFRDGGDDFPMKYASHHWTDRVCVDPVVFADLQAIAKTFGAELQPRAWYPPETIYFHLAGALVGVFSDYLDFWTDGGLVRVDFADCPFLDYVKQLVAEKRCLCEICRKPTDDEPGPILDAETLAGFSWNQEVAGAEETFERLEAALEDEELELPVEEIASLTGLARRKAELLLAVHLAEVDVDDARMPAALVKLAARWTAPALFAPCIDKDTSSETRETLQEAVRALLKLPRPPVVTTGELVDAEGVPLLVCTFVGEYVAESDGEQMQAARDALLETYPTAQGILFDASELSFTRGKRLGRVFSARLPRMWATSPLSSGLHEHIRKERDLLPDEWIAPSRDAAIAALRARVVADVYEIHDANGVVVETARREPAGRRHHLSADENGQKVAAEILHSLTGGYLELVTKYENGVVRVEEFPVLDAQGKENAACRLGAKAHRLNGELYKVDFNRNASGQAVPPDWVDRVAAFPTIKHVSLDLTDVPTSEILRLLERCPQLFGLYLNRRKVDAELFTSPLLRDLQRLQLHEAEVPPGAIAQLAALHPWIDIQPPPAFETSGRRVDAEGGAILVVSFAGLYDSDTGARMKTACDALLTQHPDVAGIVLDATNLVYATGKEIGEVLAEGRPFGWAVSSSSRGLFRHLRVEQDREPREWLYPSVEAAIAAVRAQIVADAYEVHDATAKVRWHTWRKEPRGRRRCGWRVIDGVEMSDETLFDFRGRVIEDLYRRPDGTFERIFEFPIRDEAGGESDACRMGAKLYTKDGKLVTIEYSVQLTHLPLPTDWVERIAAHRETVTCINLDGTGATTADIVEVLARCPNLERLWLNSLSLDAEFFAAPRLASVKVLWLWNTTVPPGAVKELAARVPTIDINPKSLLE